MDEYQIFVLMLKKLNIDITFNNIIVDRIDEFHSFLVYLLDLANSCQKELYRTFANKTIFKCGIIIFDMSFCMTKSHLKKICLLCNLFLKILSFSKLFNRHYHFFIQIQFVDLNKFQYSIKKLNFSLFSQNHNSFLSFYNQYLRSILQQSIFCFR